jgi:class 3 adenylate cyclase/type II secretory pathway pseudopilin PulG
VADSDSPATPDLERKLATILSADVAAYSRLMAEDEELTLRTFRGHKEVFEKLVELHRGRVFNTAGDAILAEFGSAVEAVRCATEIQAALRTRNDQLPEDRQVRFRIGVNLGDVMVQGQDLLGDGVNVAARLQGAAEPGGVCIAGSVYDQIRNKLSLSFTPLGEMSYKNIPQPVRTFAIAEADGLGILPAPARKLRLGAGRVWAATAIVLMLAAAGVGVWGYSDYRQSRAEAAHAAAVAAQKTADEAAKAAQQRVADAAQQKTLAEQKRIDSEANRLAEENRNRSETTQLAAVTALPRVAPPEPDLPPSAATLPKPASAGDPTGVYGGPICFGPGETDPARCFRAQAVVRNKTISGQWPGRTPGATVYLAGDVTRAGDVAIHMHTKRADGSRFAVIDLVGKLRDGRIDATGSFRNGRSVSLNWRKD